MGMGDLGDARETGLALKRISCAAASSFETLAGPHGEEARSAVSNHERFVWRKIAKPRRQPLHFIWYIIACKRRFAMPLNTDKIDDAALALLYLTLHDDYRAWKGFDWGVLGRLHDKGMIHDPIGKVKSVVFTEEGLQRAKALFEEMFKE
jgi:hypothetical protein